MLANRRRLGRLLTTILALLPWLNQGAAIITSPQQEDRDNEQYRIDLVRSRRYETLLTHDIIPSLTNLQPLNEASSSTPSHLRKRKTEAFADCTTMVTVRTIDPLPGKKGVGVSFSQANKVTSLQKLHALNPSWNFSWNSVRIPEQPADVEFVPMLWGASGGVKGLKRRIEQDIVPAFDQGLAKRVIVFQSPDLVHQSNLPVSDVVDTYWDTLTSYGIPLTSPTTSNVMGPWMRQFFASAQAQCLPVEYVALQWYGPPDVEAFQSRMQMAWNEYGHRPLLITDLAVTDPQATTKEENQWSAQEVMEFAKQILPWLESQEWVAGYAWVVYDTENAKGTSSALFQTDLSLTPLGKYYQSITPSTPEGDLSIQMSPSADQPTSLSPSQVPSTAPSKCNEPLPIPAMPGKKGIGYVLTNPDTLLLNLDRIRALDLSWNYSWSPELIEEQPPELEFIPMIWGAWGEQGVRRRIEKDIVPQFQAGRVHRFLAFNEPDIQFQSNLSVEQVIGYWPLLQEPGIPLASPSVGHALGTWMQDFMQQVESKCLRVEYTAIHWYKNPNPARFKEDMMEAYQRYGQRPILLTEFAPADWEANTPEQNRHTQQEVLAFTKEVLPWLERQSFIAGYAWFPFKPSFAPGSSSALFDSDDGETLTALGRFYKSVTPSNPDGDQSIQ